MECHGAFEELGVVEGGGIDRCDADCQHCFVFCFFFVADDEEEPGDCTKIPVSQCAFFSLRMDSVSQPSES